MALPEWQKCRKSCLAVDWPAGCQIGVLDRRLIVGCEVVTAGLRTGSYKAEHRQSAEPEKVELRHVDEVEIVLVELEDRAAHRRLLDGHVIA